MYEKGAGTLKNIILIGFMGAGKTTFGTWLAKKREYQFLDTDEMIEKEQGISISEIFEQFGEEAFRDMETALIQKLITENTDSCIISVGGGLPVREENRRLLQDLGTVIYLRASVETLCERLEGDTTRPLLKGGSLRTKIVSLMEKREALYEDAANRIIDTDGCTYEDVERKVEEV